MTLNYTGALEYVEYLFTAINPIINPNLWPIVIVAVRAHLWVK